jgi:LysM repeat protein
VSEYITCFACDKEPTQQCPRCGRPYCDDHGEELCDACLEPASGVPSFTLYRGSLLALLVGTALAVWLLVQPSNADEDSSRPQVVTPTAVVGQATTPDAGATNGAGGTPEGGTPATPSTTGTRPAGTTTPGTTPPAGTTTYTVQSGDTLSGICQTVKPASMSVDECVTLVRSLNSLSSDSIATGQTLRVPSR